MTGPGLPEVLRSVADDVRGTTEIGRFLDWLGETRGLHFEGYDALHRWSVEELAGFWAAIWDFFGVRAHRQYETVLGRREMPGAVWFPGVALNYAEHAVEPDGDAVAIVAYSQTRDRADLTWAQLRDRVTRARAGLQRLGVGRGDRVAAYLPNIPETVVAFLATASLGAIWACCAPEFGPRGVIDRFAQIEPAVLLTVCGYVYGAKHVDRTAEVAEIRRGLPTVRHVVQVPFGPDAALPDALGWGELLAEAGALEFVPVPFGHPLCVLFSSGTTGKPKAIVHSHGGILLEHLKNHALS